jgi:hypothetical protein
MHYGEKKTNACPALIASPHTLEQVRIASLAQIHIPGALQPDAREVNNLEKIRYAFECV